MAADEGIPFAQDTVQVGADCAAGGLRLTLWDCPENSLVLDESAFHS